MTYWKAEVMERIESEFADELANAAVGLATEILDNARNAFGVGLTDKIRARLLTLIESPSPWTWEDAYTIIVNSRDTVWQACRLVDDQVPSSAPQTDDVEQRWPYVPDSLTIVLAINNAINGAQA